MPIKGLTTKRRLSRLGKIRLGIKAVSQNGKEYPKAVDYFVCPPEVQEVYGEKPAALEIVLPVDAEELVASTYYKAYSASRGLVCKGDGVSANRLIDASQKGVEPETGVITGPIAAHDAQATEMALGIACPGRDCPYYQGQQCRELMSLQFLMPNVPGLGVWQLDTSSYHSIVNIYSGMELIRGIFGSAAMIPLTLSLEPMEVSPGGFKKTVHVLHLRSGGTLAQIAEQRSQPLVPGLMPAPDEEREELLFPEGGHEPEQPAKPVTPALEAPPAAEKPQSGNGRTSTASPKPGGKLGNCATHDRAWGIAADNKVGHPLGEGQWCWKEQQDGAASTAPKGNEESPQDAPEPDSREELESRLDALGWEWKAFETRVLAMPWPEWLELGGTAGTAWRRFGRWRERANGG